MKAVNDAMKWAKGQNLLLKEVARDETQKRMDEAAQKFLEMAEVKNYMLEEAKHIAQTEGRKQLIEHLELGTPLNEMPAWAQIFVKNNFLNLELDKHHFTNLIDIIDKEKYDFNIGMTNDAKGVEVWLESTTSDNAVSTFSSITRHGLTHAIFRALLLAILKMEEKSQ